MTFQRGCSQAMLPGPSSRRVSRRRRRLQFGSNLAARRRSQVYDTDDHIIRDEPRLREATEGDFPPAHPRVWLWGAGAARLSSVIAWRTEQRGAAPRRSAVSASVLPRNFRKSAMLSIFEDIFVAGP